MKITFDGGCVWDTDDNLICAEDNVHIIYCGCGESKLKLKSHADGEDFYENHFECLNCGNKIVFHNKRSEEW